MYKGLNSVAVPGQDFPAQPDIFPASLDQTLLDRSAQLAFVGPGWQVPAYDVILCISLFFPIWRNNGLSIECHSMENIYSLSLE